MGFSYRFLGPLALAAAFALGEGCITANTNRLPVSGNTAKQAVATPAETNNKRSPGEPYKAVDIKSGFDSLRYDVKLGKKIQTTPTHPDDTRLKPNETEVPLGVYHANGLRLGAEGSFGVDNELRFKVGADIRYGFLRDGDHITMLEERQQNTDVPGSKSYAFTRMTQDRFTFTPVIGCEKDFFGIIRIGVEGGFPYTGFDVESGYDRLGQFQTAKKDSWSGFGKRFGVTIDSQSLIGGISIFAGTEEFNPKFGNEDANVESSVVFFGYRYRF